MVGCLSLHNGVGGWVMEKSSKLDELFLLEKGPLALLLLKAKKVLGIRATIQRATSRLYHTSDIESSHTQLQKRPITYLTSNRAHSFLFGKMYPTSKG
jgi:hypothetical protein